MIKHNFPGAGARLGNKIFVDVMMSLLAKKYDYKIQSFLSQQECAKLGIQLFSGSIEKTRMQNYTDNNLMQLTNQNISDIDGINYTGYCQSPEVITKHIEEINEICNRSLSKEPIEETFIHIRLGDLAYSQNMKPLDIEYYEECIDKSGSKNIVISTDTPNHHLIKTLLDKHGAKIFISTDPVEVINFGRRFSKIIASFGTFSWWIAFLSGHKNIYYPSPQRPGNFSPFLGLSDWNFV